MTKAILCITVAFVPAIIIIVALESAWRQDHGKMPPKRPKRKPRHPAGLPDTFTPFDPTAPK